MKKFIVRVILFSILSIVLVNVLLLSAGRHNQYIGGIKLKHELLKNTQDPKIIIVGGSGAGHSIDSKMIAQQTGLETVNMGLFAQFGLHYLLEEIMNDVKQGDLVVLTPEYHQLYYFFNGWRGFNELIFVYPQALFQLKTKAQYETILRSFPRFYRRKINSIDVNVLLPAKKDTLYNEYGDYVAHLKDTTNHDIAKLNLFHDFVDMSNMNVYPKAIDIINEYSKKIADKGAFLVFSYPTIPDKQFSENTQKIRDVEMVIEELGDFEVINTPNLETQPVSDFHDTVYHLNKEGRLKRTSRLINEILESRAYKTLNDGG